MPLGARMMELLVTLEPTTLEEKDALVPFKDTLEID